MNKKRILWVTGAALALVVLLGALGVTAVFAQEPEPPTDEASPGFGRSGGRGFFGRGFFGGGEDRWTRFDTMAEALGLTPEELFAELHAGSTLEEIAEAQGIDMEAVTEAMHASRVEQMRAAIEQAVADGTMDADRAEWLLEGLDQGFFPMRGLFGRMHGERPSSLSEGE